MRRMSLAFFAVLATSAAASAPASAVSIMGQSAAPPPVVVQTQTTQPVVMASPAPVVATAAKPASPVVAKPAAKPWGGQVRYTISADVGRFLSSPNGYALAPFEGALGNVSRRGWQGAVSFGAEIGRDWAVMLEGQYMRDPTEGVSKREAEVMAAFLTGHYRIPMAGYFRPYIGAGVGVAGVSLDGGARDMMYGVKALAGLDVAVGETMSVYGQYELIYLDDLDSTSGVVHGGRLGLKKRF